MILWETVQRLFGVVDAATQGSPLRWRIEANNCFKSVNDIDNCEGIYILDKNVGWNVDLHFNIRDTNPVELYTHCVVQKRNGVCNNITIATYCVTITVFTALLVPCGPTCCVDLLWTSISWFQISRHPLFWGDTISSNNGYLVHFFCQPQNEQAKQSYSLFCGRRRHVLVNICARSQTLSPFICKQYLNCFHFMPGFFLVVLRVWHCVGVHIVCCACRIQYDRMKLHCLLGVLNKMYISARCLCVQGLWLQIMYLRISLRLINTGTRCGGCRGLASSAILRSKEPRSA